MSTFENGPAVSGTSAITTFSLYEQFPDLFSAVASERDLDLHRDGKVLTDCMPLLDLEATRHAHKVASGLPGYDAREFLARYFVLPDYSSTGVPTEKFHSLDHYISDTWKHLTYHEPDDYGTFIGLKHPAFKPGQRFRETYYWDTDDGLLGFLGETVQEEGLDFKAPKWQHARGVVQNFADLIDKFGYIPNGTRTYYLTRSQPPKFAGMVKQLSEAMQDPQIIEEYLPQITNEYNWWMSGEDQFDNLGGVQAINSVVKLPAMDGGAVILNRYWDYGSGPRPESRMEDLHIAARLPSEDRDAFFKHQRTGAASGKDFTAEWFADPERPETIQTANMIPIELNCLLWEYEDLIARAHERVGRSNLAAQFYERAARRVAGINTYLWNPDAETGGTYQSFNFVKNEQNPFLTMGIAYPGYYGISTPEQNEAVSGTLITKFLKPGGFISSLLETGQQWDAPNGWAPHQRVGAGMLDKSGKHIEAEMSRQAWLASNTRVLQIIGALVEKNNVLDLDSPIGGGGEYKVQVGFLWTNGICRHFLQKEVEFPGAELL